MPENEQIPNPESGEQNPPAETTTETTSGEGEGEAEKPAEKPALTLEEALSEVTKTRGEAANYRTRAKQAEEALKNAKTLDEVNAIVAQMTEERTASERTLLAENVALKHNLPEALAARLQGSTREELEADAKALAALLPPVEEEIVPEHLSGGLSPHDERNSEPTDPGELARKHAPRRR